MAIINTANFSCQHATQEFSVSASSTVDIAPKVEVTKTSHPVTVSKGDVVTYFVTIILSDFVDEITDSVFSDVLPERLEFIADTLTVDAEKVSGDISNLPLSFTGDGEHLIVYQCKVL